MKKLFLPVILGLLFFNSNAQQNSLTPQQQNAGNGYYEINVAHRGQHGDIVVGDIDNDGDLDFIIGGEQRNSPWMYQGGIYINNGSGKFTQKEPNTVQVTPGGYSYMDLGDINGDGFIDLIFVGHSNSGTKTHKGIALNDGTGNFIPGDSKKYPMPPNRSTYCAFADFNNDGLLDYFVTGTFTSFGARNQSYSAVYIQQPDGSFLEDKSSFLEYPLTDAICSIVDFENDGYMDIFVTGFLDTENEWPVCPFLWSRFTVPFRNDGTGKFHPIYIHDDVSRKGFGSVDWADVDGNGYLDFILYGESYFNQGEDNQYITRIYKQVSAGLFKEAYMYDGARPFSIGGAVVLQDFNNDGKPDALFGGWCPNLTGGARQKTFIVMNNNADGNITHIDFKENNFLSNTYLPGMSEQDFEVADFNGDFKLDFLYFGYAGGEVKNPVHPARNIFGWSPMPENKDDLDVKPFLQLTAPTNLKSQLSGTSENQKVVLSWDEPANNMGRKGTTYNLYLKELNTGKLLYSPLAVVGGDKDGWRQVNRMGNMNLNKRWELALPPGEYEWTVQAVDAARFGGNFAPKQIVSISTGVAVQNSFNPNISNSEGILYIKNCPVNEDFTLNIYTPDGVKVKNAAFRESYSVSVKSGVYVVELIGNSSFYTGKVLIL